MLTLLPVRLLMLACALLIAGCATSRPGTPAYHRQGDEIMVCGRLFHTGAPVVLWTDPGGYDAYRVEKRFGPLDKSSWEALQKEGKAPETPNRYNTRFFRFAEQQPEFSGSPALTPEMIARVRGGGWDLPSLQRVVDQFVIHYDVCGTSRQCFRILHDVRGLSVHFMLDIDGTIYQTLDLKERAWHATSSNDRSIGIEIANIGAYPLPSERPLPEVGESPWRRGVRAKGESDTQRPQATQPPPLPPTLSKWYTRDESGWRIRLPDEMGDGGVRTPNFIGRPSGGEAIIGPVQGRALRQFDLTPEQYASLIKLTAALCSVFPNLTCDYPRDESGLLITGKLPDDRLAAYRGLIGHYHIQKDKVDPGPAFQWDSVVDGARKHLRHLTDSPNWITSDFRTGHGPIR